MATTVTLDGRSLSIADVMSVARQGARVAVDQEAARRAQVSRAPIERAAAGDGAVYGLNTGFGKLASVRVPQDQLLQLQRNLILSHVAGVGAPFLPSRTIFGTRI
jgi:histidine ammonia-lyase